MTPEPLPCRPRWILLSWLLSLLVSAVTLAAAAQARAMEACDDAFISFRVARNLARGFGLVFNEGGLPSEAASNFLYTALLAVGHALGLPLIQTALALDLILLAGTLLLLAWLVARTVGRMGLWASPVLASLTLVHHNAVNGLETMMVGLLVLAAAGTGAGAGAMAERSGREGRRGERLLALSSLFWALVSMTRPEGPIYIVAFGFCRGSRWISRRRSGEPVSVRAEAAWLLPFGLFYLPYLAFRLLYFGQLLPNAYWAKDAFFSGSLAKVAQGALYLGTMILSEPLLLVGLAAGAWMWHVESNGRRRLLTLIIAVQILFMVLSGGDWPHMFGHGRFLYPVLPLCIWLLADAGALLWRRGHRSSLAMAAAALLVLSQLDLFGLSGVKLAPHFHLMRQGGRPPLTRQALARSYGRDLARKPAAVWWREATALFHTGRYRGSFDARAALWLQQKYGRETAIAAIQAGQFAYWSEMPFFDLFGLATPGVAPLRDDGRGMMAALGADNVRIVAFYRWGGDLHNRGVVGEGSLWRAGYGLRHVLQQGTRRAFVLFERGHKSELDPVKVLHTPLKDLPALVGPEVHVKIP